MLCVYTAVHLNILKKGITKSQLYRKKTGWVVLGIFMPELVLYTAWSQWYSAKKLTARVKSILDDNVIIPKSLSDAPAILTLISLTFTANRSLRGL